MNSVLKISLAMVVLVAMTTILYLASSALERSGVGYGLVNYFARLGIEVDLRVAFIAVGLIPVAWLVGFIIRTWSVK